MQIYSVYDPEFKPYGKVMKGYDTAELTAAMEAISMPEAGVAYEASIGSLEACAIFAELRDRGFGGMPIEIGMCWGYNTKLNCLEYHRDSEINIGAGDFILLVARMEDIEDGKLDTAKVKAFRAPAGAVVEVYATTLHYAPCGKEGQEFRCGVVLPKGTNEELREKPGNQAEDRLLFADNKWLIAHPESGLDKDGAFIGLKGENIRI